MPRQCGPQRLKTFARLAYGGDIGKDRDLLTLRKEQRQERAGNGAFYLHQRLIGFDLAQRFTGGDLIADPFLPADKNATVYTVP